MNKHHKYIYLFIITLFAIGFSLVAYKQVWGEQDGPCGFLNNLKFKNGADTIVIRAIFKDLAKYPDDMPISRILLKARKIAKDFNSQVAFQPDGCSKIYSAPLNRNAVYEEVEIGEKVYITCVVFERKDRRDKDTPFFMVIKVKKTD